MVIPAKNIAERNEILRNRLKTANILAHSVNKLNHTAHTLPRSRPPSVNRNIAFTRFRRKKFSRKPDFFFL